MAPGAKFSTNTSARRAKSLTSCSPRGVLRLAVIDFLLALKRRKYQESPACPPRNELRPGSPPLGFSTLTTSAPSQASASVHEGPASNCVRSTIRTPARQPGNAPLLAPFVAIVVVPPVSVVSARSRLIARPCEGRQSATINARHSNENPRQI